MLYSLKFSSTIQATQMPQITELETDDKTLGVNCNIFKMLS